MTVLTYTPPPGLYEANQTVTVTPQDDVEYFIIGTDDQPPALSEYIAYDNLVPPGPFLAVTQDGKGNVVYDGGFPKFYNDKFAGESWPGFSAAPAAFKFLYNALNFCKNEVKYAAGNRKVFILGDRSDTFRVNGTADNDFKKTFDMVLGAAGYVPIYRLAEEYDGGKIDCTYAGLDEYVCVIVLSAGVGEAGPALITDRGTIDLVSTRASGTGIILITDDNRFTGTANKIAVNFGARFEGLYNRGPVNVGFLRATYGDHPLYDGMLDSESIYAGPSESKVVVAQATRYDRTHPAPLQGMTGIGAKYLRILAKMKDGTIKVETSIYIIGEGNAPIEPTDPDGNVIRGELILDRNLGQASVLLTPVPNSTMFGFVRAGKDGETIIGEFRSSDGVQEYYWYHDPSNLTPVSPQFRVETGDKLILQLLLPFEYSTPINIVVDKPASKESSFARALNRYLLRCFPIVPGGSEYHSFKALISQPSVKFVPHKAQRYLCEVGETFEPDRPSRFDVIIADEDNPIEPLKGLYGKGDGLIYDYTTDQMYRYAYTGWELVVADRPYTVSKFFGINSTLVAKNSNREYFVNYVRQVYRIK